MCQDKTQSLIQPGGASVAIGPKKLEKPFNPPQEEEAVFCLEELASRLGCFFFPWDIS